MLNVLSFNFQVSVETQHLLSHARFFFFPKKSVNPGGKRTLPELMLTFYLKWESFSFDFRWKQLVPPT